MTSRLLVIGQFGSIGVLLFAGGWQLPLWAWGVFALGLVIFASAVASLGNSNFTIMPDPRTGNTLSRRGIYGFLRHPMYTAVLLCGAAVSFGEPSPARWVALAVCVVVLVIKVRYEERLLSVVHPEYQTLMKGAARLCPCIW